MSAAFLLAAALHIQPAPELRPSPPPPPPPPSLKIIRQPDPKRFYPASERKAGREGATEIGLVLRNDGRVSRCSVIVRSGSPALDAAACKLGRSLRFEPSSFAGRSAKSEYGCCLNLDVRWAGGTGRIIRLMPPIPPLLRNAREIVGADDYPAAALRAEEEGTVAADVAVSAEGTVTGCTIAQSSGSAALDAATCGLALARGQALPGRDRYGEPAAGTARFRITWRLAPAE